MRATQAKLIEMHKAIDKGAFTIKSSDLWVDDAYEKAKNAKQP